MIVEAGTLQDGAEVAADVCIIGGGAAGITLARELSHTRLRVCLLEGGGLSYEAESQALAAGETSGVPYFDLAESRFRMLGGSTYRWGARGRPMQPIDFQQRPWVPLSGWPISLAELEPYYDRVHELIGWHRPFHFDGGVWRHFGIQPPPLDERRLAYCAFQFGKTLLFGTHFRKLLEQATNVRVYLHANAVLLAANGAGNHLEAVEARKPGGSFRVRAKYYVLACGGIENARLLLLSNDVVPSGLCNERDLVGRYFMEHPTFTAGELETADPWRVLDLFTPGLLRRRLVEVGMCLSPEVQGARRCCNAVVHVKPVVDGDATQALRELLAGLVRRQAPDHTRRLLRTLLRDPGGVMANLLRHALGRPKRFRIQGLRAEVRTEQEPNRASRVTLAEARDALGLRKAHVHWVLSERDRLTMCVMAEVFGQEMERLGLGRLLPGAWIREHSEAWPAHPGLHNHQPHSASPNAQDSGWPPDLVGGHHHMGTTRMSQSPQDGVVDPDCRAHAVDNLFIAGSSVFPTAGFVNPTPTILALTLRLAEHIKHRCALPGAAGASLRSA